MEQQSLKEPKSKVLNKALVSGMFKTQDFKLCYVDDGFAYFTTKPLTEQWGNDWDDAPYEHNAGTPYTDECMEIVKLAYSADMDTPRKGHLNSPFSVETINTGAVAWLRSSTWSKVKVAIQAGATLEEFIDKIELVGGEVYLPSSWFVGSYCEKFEENFNNSSYCKKCGHHKQEH